MAHVIQFALILVAVVCGVLFIGGSIILIAIAHGPHGLLVALAGVGVACALLAYIMDGR